MKAYLQALALEAAAGAEAMLLSRLSCLGVTQVACETTCGIVTFTGSTLLTQWIKLAKQPAHQDLGQKQQCA